MIQDKTTLILGAGASCHYGFPTGEKLIKKVCQTASGLIDQYNKDKINQTLVFNPASQQAITFQKISHIFYGTEPKLPGHYENEAHQDRAEDLKKKLENLSSKIKSLDPLNIDTFLRDHPSLQDVGTFLIAFVLLRCESLCKSVPENDHNKDKNQDSNNWYRFLIHVLADCDNSEELKKVFLDEQKLLIITFNYDVSLEYHLYNSLKQIEKFQDAARNFMKAFSENCIFHVYGALHAIDWDVPDPFAEFGTPSESSDGFDFLKKVKLARQCSQNIKTIYKAKDNKCPKYKEKKKKFIESIDHSGRLVILGYGFDDANTKHLSDLSDGKNNGLISALKTKRLYMTNYNDSKRIENKLNLKEREDYHFISDKNVYNALMYDFDLVS